jgi:uncharacterized protein
MKRIITIIGAVGLLSFAVQAQVLLSSGLTYLQNFDTLTATTTSAGWTDNANLLGWYAERAYTSGTTGTLGSYPYGSFHYGDGLLNNSGWIKSYGVAGVNPITDRAFGSLGSGTPKTNAIGLRIFNDTGSAVSLDSISFRGEQYRIGQGNFSSVNTLYFSYRTSSSSITDPAPNVPWYDTATWTPFSALDFVNPKMATASSDPAAGLDGNASGNYTVLSSTFTGVVIQPGWDLFLRWVDPDEAGNDMGLAIDDFQASFSIVPEPSTALLGGLGLLALAIWRRKV